MASVTSVATACLLACLFAVGCGGDAEPDDGLDDTSTSTTDPGPTYQPPGGKVVFDLQVRSRDRHPAISAYASWQRAATEGLRRRDLSTAITDNAADAPVDVVKSSLETIRAHDYVVPRRMIGKVQSARTSERAAIVNVCLWSESFDYRDRESGKPTTADNSRWLGVEVRMTRSAGHDKRWIVAGLAKRADCEGSKP